MCHATLAVAGRRLTFLILYGEHKDVWGVWRQPARWALIWLDETTAEVSRFGREVLGACGGRRRGVNWIYLELNLCPGLHSLRLL